jgi:hypothetical protein
LGKKFAKLHLNEKKLGIVEHICHSSYCGKPKIDWVKSETLSQSKQSKKGLEVWHKQ